MLDRKPEFSIRRDDGIHIMFPGSFWQGTFKRNACVSPPRWNGAPCSVPVLRSTPGSPHLPTFPLHLPNRGEEGETWGDQRARTLAIPHAMVAWARCVLQEIRIFGAGKEWGLWGSNSIFFLSRNGRGSKLTKKAERRTFFNPLYLWSVPGDQPITPCGA